MIEHCISSLTLHSKEKLFRTYVTDALMAIAENTAHLTKEGKYFKTRWIELESTPATRQEEPEEDNRPCEEIAADIWKKIRGN